MLGAVGRNPWPTVYECDVWHSSTQRGDDSTADGTDRYMLGTIPGKNELLCHRYDIDEMGDNTPRRTAVNIRDSA